MAEDALPKDERRQTMKRIIAILLALIMIFAFAACKGKDDKCARNAANYYILYKERI